ncbi:MAG: DNA repair protein RecO [Ruminococcus sp.]|nr:DNA repair protein RecO [Ruminococcus sp.]
MTTLDGIVLRERLVGEQDKFIDILTKERGVLELSVKGARKINGRSGSSAQLFAYSRFCMNERKGRLYLNSAEPIHIFYDLRSSLSRISLASYFAEAASFCSPENSQCEDILRLLLNCLHYLEKGTRSEAFLKSLFELRLMSDSGFMPDIVGCHSCGAFEPEVLYFSVRNGIYLCSDCHAAVHEGSPEMPDEQYIKLELPVLLAMRHIVLADFDRLFNFRVSDGVQEKLSAISEDYLRSHLGRDFRTLNFYHSIV